MTKDQREPKSTSVTRIKRKRFQQKKSQLPLIVQIRSKRIIIPHDSFRSITTTSLDNQHQDERKTSSLTNSSVKFSRNIVNSTTVTRVPRYGHPAIQNLDRFNDNLSTRDIHENYDCHSTTNDITDKGQLHIKTKDTLANHTDYINKKDQTLKKKKKICLITTILTIIILCITLIVLLTVFLTKPKTSVSVSRPTNPVLRWKSTGITVAGISGVSGSNSSQLDNPWGIVITYDYTLYVSDRLNHRVQKYSMNFSTIKTVAGLINATACNTSECLYRPAAILLDSNENLYIADGYNHRAQYWAKDASSGVTIAGSGLPGNASNQMVFAYGITRDPNSDIVYVADHYNHRIMGYKPGNTTGFIVAGGNGAGLNNTQLNFPISVYFESSSQSLIIVNIASSNIVRWILGESQSTLVVGSISGVNGNTSTLLDGPVDFTFDPMNNLYVADRGNHRIQLYLSDQSDAITIAGITGQFGDNSTLLNQPYAVALDNQLNLYVVDNQNHRVQKFLRY